MSDDKTRQGLDRKFVAGGEDYEVRHFADRHAISADRHAISIEQERS